MIAGKRVLAVIPARGGSKGVPGKNIRALAGRPLIAWTGGALQMELEGHGRDTGDGEARRL